MILGAKWLVGVVAYLGLSAILSHALAFGMAHWVFAGGGSRGMELEMQLLRSPVFAISLLSGALYASALAKPHSFGRSAKILKHLGLTYFLILLACAFLIRTVFFPLPNFQSNFAGSAYLFGGFSLSFIFFVLGIFAWVRLAFGAEAKSPKESADNATLNS
jgi:hypothetical protein